MIFMKTWVLSIVITVILISIFTIILPKNKTGNLVKSLFHVLLVSLIIKPFYNREFNFENVFNFNQQEFEIQQDYIDGINLKKISHLKENCIQLLENNGIHNSNIEIEYEFDKNQNLSIQKIVVNLSNSVIIPNNMNIDIIVRTKSLISKSFNINENLVEVYV